MLHCIGRFPKRNSERQMERRGHYDQANVNCFKQVFITISIYFITDWSTDFHSLRLCRDRSYAVHNTLHNDPLTADISIKIAFGLEIDRIGRDTN